MWPTSEGDRTLRGGEAIVLAKAVDTMLSELVNHLGYEADDPAVAESFAGLLQSGIGLFDSLALSQRIAALHHATHHLLTDQPLPSKSPSAIEDATVAAIYSEVRDQIEIEIDLSKPELAEPTDDQWGYPDEPLMSWRRDVRDACCELLGEGHWAELKTDEQLADLEMGEWELWVDLLASAILWDRDFEFADSFLDADPAAARRQREALGISDDYFIRPAPDPNQRHLDKLIEETRNLVRSVQSQRPGPSWPLEDEAPF